LALTLQAITACAQDVDRYLEKIRIQYNQIIDYQADMQIEVDVDFIRMPVKSARIFFKQPDKVKFKSDEFIMLPKVGVDFAVNKLLNSPYRAIFNGFDQNLDGLAIIQILPIDPHSDVILSTVWVDTLLTHIKRAEIFTRSQGNFTIDMTYKENDVLPDKLIISFEIEQMNIPLKFIGKSIEIDKEMMKQSKQTVGSVTVSFSNYHINSGLKDADFLE
jgi:hypothetical protein